MMIDQISGNPSGDLLATRTNAAESTSFNSVLSEKTSPLAAGGKAPEGLPESSRIPGLDEPTLATPVKIGTITSKNPTVSNLLIRNPALKKECWNIIYDRQNRDKAYTAIPTGTDIYYNPGTKEILWGDMIEKGADVPVMASPARPSGILNTPGAFPETAHEKPAAHQAAAGSESNPGGLNESMVKAVEPMIGRSYSDMNCYELLVNGLSKMGVRYFGQGGLGRQMMAGAVDKGLPMNAYLNGEGLIRFSGSETYSKSFNKVNDPAGQARQVIEEMAAHLEKGSILSFSTESRGHTGIVSNKNGAWTFINSGVMDNSVGKGSTRKGVGEESLDKEIENWFRLAANRNESLVITMGKLNQNKLATFAKNRTLAVS